MAFHSKSELLRKLTVSLGLRSVNIQFVSRPGAGWHDLGPRTTLVYPPAGIHGILLG